MNELNDSNGRQSASDVCHEIDGYVRRNPVAAVISGLFVGMLIAGAVIGAKSPPTRRQRLARILSDLEDDLRHVVAPVITKSKAAIGAQADRATQEGRAGVKRLDGVCRNWWERITAIAG